MQSTQSVSSAMQSGQRQALGALAFALSVIVYIAGLVYAGVRSYTLFAATIAAGLLPLAVLGIVALEVSALALPLTIHYWAAPGAQRMAAYGFYFADLALIIGNAILDAAHHSGAVLPGFMQAYGTFAVPGLPVLCMAGWALLWTLDPASREADLVATVRTATHEALLTQIQKATEAVDITEAVEVAAGEAARALVGETLGRAPKRSKQADPASRWNISTPKPPELETGDPEAQLPPAVMAAIGDILSRGDDLPTGAYPAAHAKKARQNGHKATEAAPHPK